MKGYILIGRPGGDLDTLRRRLVSCRYMSRVIGPILLACAAALGCSSASRPNEMAPTPRLDPPVEVRTAPAVSPPPPASFSHDGIAPRINNDIITWKDLAESLKERKPSHITPDLQKEK